MDKMKGGLISINDWKNLDDLFFIAGDDPTLGDRKVHRSEIRQKCIM